MKKKLWGFLFYLLWDLVGPKDAKARSCQQVSLPHTHTHKRVRGWVPWEILKSSCAAKFNIHFVLWLASLVCARSFLNISGVLLHVKSAMVSSPLHGASAFHDVFVIYLFLMRIKTEARKKNPYFFLFMVLLLPLQRKYYMAASGVIWI